MSSTSGVGGARGAAAPASAQSLSTVTTPESAAQLEQMLKAQQDVINKVQAKAEDKLTGADRASYARATANTKVLESTAYLSYLGKGTSEKISGKVNADMDKFLRENPNATREQIEKAVADSFKKHVGSATVGKFAFDQAIKSFQENMERMKDSFEF